MGFLWLDEGVLSSLEAAEDALTRASSVAAMADAAAPGSRPLCFTIFERPSNIAMS